MQKDLTISTVSVEIHVLRVDGHKMTKATFNQIPELKRSELFVDTDGAMYRERRHLTDDTIGWRYSNFDIRDEIKILGKVRGSDYWYLLCERDGKPVRRFLDSDNQLKEDHTVTEAGVFLEDESIPQLYIAT